MMLVWAVIGLALVTGLVMSGLDRMQAAEVGFKTAFASRGLAREVAESGLTDALAWFREQAAQPVTAFTPRLDLTLEPPVDETDDPSIGIVRSFEIAPGIWGQYIVRRGALAENFEDANGNGLYDPGEKVDDADGNGRRTTGWGTRDITHYRNPVGSGVTWCIEAEGRVFERPRADLPLGEGPNRQLGFVTLATEIHRMGLTLPGLAGIVASRGKDITIKNGTRLVSPDLAVTYRANTGGPKIEDKVVVNAPRVHAPVVGWTPSGGGDDRIQVEEVFGVDWMTLRAMADLSVGWGDDEISTLWQKPWKKDRLPTTMPDDSLVVIRARKVKGEPKMLEKIKFDKKYPLRGRGTLVIDGNVEFKKNSNSDFQGLIFVNGDVKIEGPAHFTGAIIATGKIEVKGRNGDVEAVYDPSVINRQIGILGEYRRTKSSYDPAPRFMDDTPNESVLTKRRFGGLDAEQVHTLSPTERLGP